MAVTSLRALPMLLMVALGGSEVAPSNETHWGNFVSCSCGLTCETLEGAWFGQSCSCHGCNSTNSTNATATATLRGSVQPAVKGHQAGNTTLRSADWSPSTGEPQNLQCRCGKRCTYGLQLGGGRGGTYYCFRYACNPC